MSNIIIPIPPPPEGGGVTSINTETGDITLAAGSNITITDSPAGTFTIAAIGELSQTLTNTHIFVGNVSNVATDVAASGDLTLANTGAFTLATVNASPGATTISNITTNGKGLVTANTSASTTGSGNVVLATSPTLVTPLLGTPTSGNLANCTFPTLNQNTTGSAASLSISGQTGLLTFTGLTSTNRAKTVRDAADTILELGGSYTPTGIWTSLTMVTPVLGTPTSGTLTNCTGLPIGGGGTGVTSVTIAPTATAFAGWDANKNLSANNFIEGYATTATAAGTTTLAVGDAFQQYFTGTTTQTVKLPVTSTLVLGQQYIIVNNSTGVVTVQSSGANTLQAMATLTYLVATVILTSGTGTASWSWTYAPITAGSSGANTALSNLASVAINTTLLPAADNTSSLGSSTLAWKQLFVDAGTAASPSVVFLADTNTGFYLGAAGQVNLSLQGTSKYVFGSQLKVRSGTASAPSVSDPNATTGLYLDTNLNVGLTSGGSSVVDYSNASGNLSLGLNLKLAINTGGKIVTYDNLTTAGLGITAILANVSLTGQSTSLGPTNLLASPATGTYRANIYLVDTTAGTSGTVTASIGYTDVSTTAQTQTTGTVTFGTGGAFVQSTFIFQAQTGTAITYSTTVTSAVGSPAYAVYISLERLN